MSLSFCYYSISVFYSSYSFLTSALDGGEWSVSRPGRAFTPGERTPGTHWTGDWVGPKVKQSRYTTWRRLRGEEV
jgi:hypothetical protein